MDYNKVTTKMDPCIITNHYTSTSQDAYDTSVCVLNTLKHDSCVIQVINNDVNNAITYIIETTFNGTNWNKIQDEKSVNALNSDLAILKNYGSLTRVSVKSQVASSPAIYEIYTSLKPAAYIV